ncbi:MAG: MSMEG_0568 family radical SAM protein [Actinomycetota bacterium]
MLDVATRTELAVTGVRVAAPVRRTGGAGPSDDGHVLLDGVAAALPVAADSPWVIEEGRLVREHDEGGAESEINGVVVGTVDRPKFYDLQTADGVPYHQLARLHGADVLATTVVQTCIRYEASERCRFCAIEESLAAGATTRVKTPAQLAEVAEAAHRLDGVRQVVLTTGTSAAADRGARYLARCTAAIHAAVPSLGIQVQCEPTDDLESFTLLRDAGATAIGIHVESLDDDVRRKWMPGKSTVSLDEYWRSWNEAVRVFGHNRVSTYLLVGLGEDPDELVAGAKTLIDAGVYPFVVPFRPLAGTLAMSDGATAPSPELLRNVTERVAEHLDSARMVGAEQGAGCAACGACSALPAAGG